MPKSNMPAKRSSAERKKRARARAFKPPAPIEVPAILTPGQRVALFGHVQPGDEQIRVTVTDAGAGLALVASQLLARSMLDKKRRARLTPQEQIALKLVPQITAEIKRKPGPATSPPRTPGTGDPIQDLLDGQRDGETTETVRTETGK